MAIRSALLCILCFALQAHGQVAERPERKIGDTWVVERFDLAKREVTGSREWRISHISDGSMTLEGKDPSGKTAKWITDLEGNTLELGERKFEPKYMWYAFPLSVGKRWSNKVVYPNLEGNGTITEQRTCEVLAFEEVATKAGTFKAYKIQCEGAYALAHNFKRTPMTGQSFSTDWYSPQLKRSIKLEFRNTSQRGGWSNQYVDQVTSFECRNNRMTPIIQVSSVRGGRQV